jgi:membrane associated rhomboid family serine protease
MKTSFAPSTTPWTLKSLLLSIVVVSVLSFYIGPYLVLSAASIRHLYLWQFVSYLFVHPFPASILHLAFNLYLIWTFGASLMERFHPCLFFSLFFGSAIAAGLLAWCVMISFHIPSPLLGSSPPLYALLTSWIILNPEARMLLFFAVPFKARHLLLGLIGLNLLIDLSRSDWIPLSAYIGAIFFGYFFTIIACRIRSPFPFLAGFEDGIFRILEKLTHLRIKPIRHTKIYDFKSGEPVLKDEEFMDAMLARISLYGEGTVTPEERKRMQSISEKKSFNKKQ